MAVPPPAPVALVVDDEPEVVALVCDILAELGFKALTATTETILEIAATHSPEVVLLDIMMPGIDGYSLAIRLRRDPRTASIPIVFLTGATSPIYRTLSAGLGAVAHVQKPFTLATFRAALSRALGRPLTDPG